MRQARTAYRGETLIEPLTPEIILEHDSAVSTRWVSVLRTVSNLVSFIEAEAEWKIAQRWRTRDFIYSPNKRHILLVVHRFVAHNEWWIMRVQRVCRHRIAIQHACRPRAVANFRCSREIKESQRESRVTFLWMFIKNCTRFFTLDEVCWYYCTCPRPRKILIKNGITNSCFIKKKNFI